MTKYRKIFSIVTALGILANLLFSISVFLLPMQLFEILGYDYPTDTTWLWNAAFLLAFLSLTYYPILLEPVKYLWISVVAIGARIVIGTYWIILILSFSHPSGFYILGCTDLLVALIQSITLYGILGEQRENASNEQ